jgi:GNAT superfamily N-acetyltransferase
MDIIIQKAEAKDFDAIQNLNSQLFNFEHDSFDKNWNVNWPFEEKAIKYFYDAISQEKFLALVAKDGEKIVGYLIGVIYEKVPTHIKAEKLAELENMFVLEDYRSHGIGKMLITKLKDWCKENDVEILKVGTLFKNTKAINFYKENGFEEDEIVLQMKLK